MIVVRTLGTAQIEIGETRILPTSPRKFSLLLYLAAERGRPVARTTLQDLIFPDQTEKNARHSLRELVYQLRRIDLQLDSDPQSVRLPFDGVEIDFDAFIAAARPTDDQLRSAALGFLPGYAPDHSESFSEWFAVFRARTIFDLCKSLITALAAARQVGDWRRIELASRTCLHLDPVNEEGTLALAEAMAIRGSKAQAFQLLDQYADDVGRMSPELRLPASLVKRRISERMSDAYLTQADLPFLGRDREMKALGEHLERAKSGEARCVVLSGEAGIGKTRLGEEFCKNAILSGVRVERVSTQPHDSFRPFAVFTDLVPQLLRLPGALGCSPESMVALKRLTFRGAEPETADILHDASDVVSSSVTRAIADLIDAVTAECPMLLLIDDLQWADALSRLTLAALVTARRRRRLLVLLTSRDRAVLQAFNSCDGKAADIQIAPLTAHSIAELVDIVFDHDAAVDPHLRAWFLESSGGNPFFLRCLLSHFRSTGERFVIPPTLAAILDQQIGSLTPNAAAVLGVCVCLGRNSSVDRFVAALDLPHIQLHEAVAELETAHLIKRSGDVIEAAHWLVAEAVNRLTSPIALQLLHRRAALTLGADSPTNVTTLWDCAQHWTLAGDNRRASTVLRQCAEHSLEIGRPREAAEILVRAANMVTGEDRVRLARSALQIAESANEHDVVIAAATLARGFGTTADAASVELSELFARIGEWEQIENAESRLWNGIVSDVVPAQRLKAAFGLLLVAEQADDSPLAERAFVAVQNLVESQVEIDESALLSFQLVYHSRFGDLATAESIATRMIEVAKPMSPSTAANIQWKAAVTLWMLGDIDRALETATVAYVNARTARLSRLEIRVIIAMMDWLRCLGLNDRANAYSKRLEDLEAESPDWQLDVLSVSSLAEDALARGELADAKRCLRATSGKLPTNPAARITRFCRALDARIWHIERGLPADVEAEVLAMTRFHKRGAELNDAPDLETAVAALLLYDAGEIQRASALVQRYIDEFRRSRAPYARCLQEAMCTIGWSSANESASVIRFARDALATAAADFAS